MILSIFQWLFEEHTPQIKQKPSCFNFINQLTNWGTTVVCYNYFGHIRSRVRSRNRGRWTHPVGPNILGDRCEGVRDFIDWWKRKLVGHHRKNMEKPWETIGNHRKFVKQYTLPSFKSIPSFLPGKIHGVSGFDKNKPTPTHEDTMWL